MGVVWFCFLCCLVIKWCTDILALTSDRVIDTPFLNLIQAQLPVEPVCPCLNLGTVNKEL